MKPSLSWTTRKLKKFQVLRSFVLCQINGWIKLEVVIHLGSYCSLLVFFCSIYDYKSLKSLGQFIKIERNNGYSHQNRKIESFASREETC